MDGDQTPGATASAPVAPGSDLARQFVDWAQRKFLPAIPGVFQMGPHPVGTVNVVPDGFMPEHVGAYYTAMLPEGELLEELVGGPIEPVTGINVRSSTAITIAAFLQGRTRQLPNRIRFEALARIKAELQVLVHESIHSLKVADAADMHRDAAFQKLPGADIVGEAFTEAATRAHFDDVLRASGLANADPDILHIQAADMGVYPGIIEAMEAMLRGIVGPMGSTYEAETKKVIQDGCGVPALMNLVDRYITATGGRSEARPVIVRDVLMAFAGLHQDMVQAFQRTDQMTPERAARMVETVRDNGVETGERLATMMSVRARGLTPGGPVRRSIVEPTLVILPGDRTPRPWWPAPRALGGLRGGAVMRSPGGEGLQ